MRRLVSIGFTRRLVALWLLCSPLAAAEVRINEILAINDGALEDGDGDSSDWIELHNPGATPVDLDGWSLTDDPLVVAKWVFPAVTLPPGGYLVVFASGKNRAVAGSELHTNFRLDGDGEYLGLARPDGSIAHQLAPAFPRQRRDVSFGVTTESVTPVDAGTRADVLVPGDDSLGRDWTLPELVPDGSWSAATLGVGFDVGGERPARLVSLWSLDGRFDDDAGPNDGRFVGGAPRWVDGFDGTPGGALRLDGASEYVAVAQNDVLPVFNRPAYTVSMWVRGLPQADRRVFSEGSSTNNSPVFNIGVDVTGATGAVDIFIRDAAGAALVSHRRSAGVAFDGEWHHIAWTDDGGQAALFIDGVLDPVDFSYSKRALPLDRTSIGAILRAGDSFHFAGDIDDVSIWDRVLEDGEIERLAAGGSPLALSSYDGLIETDVGDAMLGRNASLYMRVPFTLDDPDAFDALDLEVLYDDGLVAYLNGREVARRNAPVELSWNAAATTARDPDAATAIERIVLAGELDALAPGENLLAFHALNVSPDDRDFLLVPRLVASSSRLEALRFFSTPTPGGPNTGGFVDFVADTQFTVDRGFFDAPFDVEITTETPDAEIRYTLDGSEPSATTGEVYTGPIRIASTTVLRAAAFREDHRPSNVDTQTYIFLADVLRQTRPPGFPTTWGGITADYDMDPEVVGAPAFRDLIEPAFLSLPTVSLVADPDDLFGPRGIYRDPGQRGRASERRASFELISDSGDFQVNAGLRPFGNTSRSLSATPKQGLRLVFRDEYGPTRLRFPVFRDSPLESFDTLVLRTNFTDTWLSPSSGERAGAQYIRDEWVRRRQLAMGRPAAHGMFVHLFIDGLYWGVYDLTERPDAAFAASYLGGNEDDWDVIKNHEEVLDGEADAYRRLDSLARADLRDDAAYARVAAEVDVDNLIDYMILNMLAPAVDWPGNYYMSRRREPGGRWRFFSWDSDKLFFEGLGVDRTGPHWRDVDSPTKFHHALRANEEYRVRFGDRLHRHFSDDGELTTAAVTGSWRELAGEIEQAMICESARWGDARRARPYLPAEWSAAVESFVRGLASRPARVLEQFRCRVSWAGCEPMIPSVAAPVISPAAGRIDRGVELRIAAPSGEIHYTLDGSDPRLPGGAISETATLWSASATTALVGPGAPARALVPTAEIAAVVATEDWTAPEFDDSDWRSGTTGVGFERTTGFEELIGLDLRDEMDGVNASVWIRIPLTIDAPAEIASLRLRMKYDDGYVAFLNRVEVARRNAPEELSWNAAATSARPDADAVTFEDVELTDARDLLRPGRNVLAIHGLNSSASSSDMLVLPELRAGLATAARVLIEESTTVRARALDDGEWSALAEATLVVDTPLRITEIMYHPRPPRPGDELDADDFEFLELQNVGEEAIDLDGIAIAGAVELELGSDVPGGMTLAPGELAVVVRDPIAFAQRHNVAIAGRYRGRLRNSGERLRLLDRDGNAILDFTWSDRWHPETDGGGHSLVIRDPRAAPESWGESSSWRPSEAIDGSPGVDDSAPPGSRQLPGDANLDGALNLSDAVRLLLVLFSDPTLPLPCEGPLAEEGNRTLLDANGDSAVNLSDAVTILAYLFSGGPPHVLGTECVRVAGCAGGCD